MKPILETFGDAAVRVEITPDLLLFYLDDGTILKRPLTDFPTLQKASKAQQQNYRLEIDGLAVVWPGIPYGDRDIYGLSVDSLKQNHPENSLPLHIDTLKEAREVLVDSGRVEEAVRWAKGRWPVFVHDAGGRGRRAVYFHFSAPEDIGLTLKTKPSASVKFQFDRLPNQEEYLVSMIVSYKIPAAQAAGSFPGHDMGIIDIVEGYPIPETWEELEAEIIRKYGSAEGKFIYKFRRLKFFPEIREAFEGFVKRIFAPVEQHELHTDTGAYDESLMVEAVIKTSYTIVTPESAEEGDFAEAGWIDEKGHDCEPDEIDREENLDRVDLAVRFLRDEGAFNYLDEDVYEGSSDQDYATGAETTNTYHLAGFSEDELEDIRLLMKGEKRPERSTKPHELHTDVDAYDESLMVEAVDPASVRIADYELLRNLTEMASITLGAYKFYSYSNDHLPPNFHIIRGKGKSAKKVKLELDTWILTNNRNWSNTDLNHILKTAKEHRNELNTLWRNTHPGLR